MLKARRRGDRVDEPHHAGCETASREAPGINRITSVHDPKDVCNMRKGSRLDHELAQRE